MKQRMKDPYEQSVQQVELVTAFRQGVPAFARAIRIWVLRLRIDYRCIWGAQEQQSRAGWPGSPYLELIRPILFHWPTQHVDLSKLSSPRLLTYSRGSRNQSCVAGSPARAAFNFYITIARFSSSCIKTGRAQPAISTRPAASSAAFGETP